MTKRTIFGTIWGIVLMLSLYILSTLIGMSWGFSLEISIAIAIISGGISGIIIGSNEMAPHMGAVTGGVILGITFVVLSSLFPLPGMPILFFIQGLIIGGITGAISAVFVHMVSYE